MNEILDADWRPAEPQRHTPDCVYSSGAGCGALARGALRERCRPARRYIAGKHWSRVAKAQRMAAGSLLFFAWACVLALLVG